MPWPMVCGCAPGVVYGFTTETADASAGPEDGNSISRASPWGRFPAVTLNPAEISFRRFCVVPYPYSKVLFAQFTRCQTQHGLNFVEGIGGKPVTVEAQEQSRRYENNSLVAIHERMVSGQTEPISRRQGGRVDLGAVAPFIDGARQRRI